MESGGIELEGIKKTGLGLTSPDFVTACLEGFEPPTFWFVAKHSIRLSYRHMFLRTVNIIVITKRKVNKEVRDILFNILFIKSL